LPGLREKFAGLRCVPVRSENNHFTWIRMTLWIAGMTGMNRGNLIAGISLKNAGNAIK